MGERLSKDIQPEELSVFKKLTSNTLLDDIQIPERPENRRLTDAKFIIVFVIVFIVFLPFMIYTLIYSDVNRITGYDQCGNICGKKNAKQGNFDCSGKDFTSQRYLQFGSKLGTHSLISLPRKCVERCLNNSVEIFGNCFLMHYELSTNGHLDGNHLEPDADHLHEVQKRMADMTKYLNKQAWRIVFACLLSLAVAMGMLVLFKTATVVVVWSILGGIIVFGGVCLGSLWYFYFHLSKEEQNGSIVMFLVMSVILTFCWLILLCVMMFLRRKIKLVIQLLKETTTAAFSMPLLFFIPVITFFSELVIVALLIATTLYMSTSGILTPVNTDFYEYKMNDVMVFTIVYNSLMAFWALQFVIGIQYMVIAGAVANWYFSRNKQQLDRPISRSAGIVFRFHLGSIAFGSMVITIMTIIRFLISSLTKRKSCKLCVDCVFGIIESFLKFLSEHSYILTAMHGKPFYKSGKRAAKIIFQNVVNIASLNYIGDFVWHMAELLIVLISLLITAVVMTGAEGDYVWAVYIIVALVSFVIAVTVFSIFKTTTDTIFLCFCEDSLLNDGMSRPYAMSRDLIEFVETSKQIYGDK